MTLAPRPLLLLLLWLAAAACAPPPPAPPTMDSSVVVDGRGVVPDLVCPGARGCEGAGGPLRVGAAAETITPVVGDEPVWIAGFDIGRQATGVHDDTWARAIVLERGALRVGVVVVDAVGLFHHEAVRLREAAAARALALDHVVLIATHTHESKDTMGMWGEAVGATGYDEAYQQLVIERAALALERASSSLVEATMTVARAEAAELVRDSRMPYVRDDALHALQWWDAAAGAPVATLVVWGNHPEALGGDNTLITSDYPHYLRDELEARLPGTVAVFAPGTLGGLTTPIGALVCPADDGVTDGCPQGTFERAEEIGRSAAAAAVDALLGPDAVDVTDVALSARRASLMLTPTNKRLALAFQLGMLSRPVFDTASGELLPPDFALGMSLDDLALGLVQIDSEVSLLSVGGVELLAVPGELYAELWLTDDDGAPLLERPEHADLPDAAFEPPLASLLPRGAIARVVLNQACDSIGYVIPAAQWDQDEPFAYDPEGQYGEENSLGEHAAPELAAGVRRLVELSLR